VSRKPLFDDNSHLIINNKIVGVNFYISVQYRVSAVLQLSSNIFGSAVSKQEVN
jgi:hypothetical protein